MFTEGEETVDLTRDGSDLMKLRQVDRGSGGGGGGGGEEANSSVRTSKRPHLVWTPQLHKRFMDVVAHLGVKNAVPKTIMQLMNVEELTRENVASHLQKYRLYLKQMRGLSNEGPSSSDHLFALTPVPQSLQESSGNGNGNSGGQKNGDDGGDVGCCDGVIGDEIEERGKNMVVAEKARVKGGGGGVGCKMSPIFF
ncbi:putative transcription factor MYB-HB-like family [Helianthus annuus]|nr:putative transcription factor MYB-HB-like family [Helianthus annuus]KAJ0899244.1 putative transcription factor MYB-HB-like family [Helianthus annuus]